MLISKTARERLKYRSGREIVVLELILLVEAQYEFS